VVLGGCGSDGGTTPADDDGGAVEAGGGDAAGDAPADGGADAPTDRVDGSSGSGFCASLVPAPKFCDDFDDGNATDDWDQATVLAGQSEITLDTTTSTSAPASLHGVVNAVPVTEGGFASVRSTVTGTPTHVTFALSVRPKTSAITKGGIAIADLDLSLNHVLTLYLRDDDPAGQKPSLKEIDGSTITYHPLPKVPPADVWTRIAFDVDAATGKLTLTYGTEKILDAITIGAGATKDPTFRVGAVYVIGPTDPFEIHVDDVVVDF
jgi:hypothetical protein